jgi:hypothetical protein
MLLIFWMQACRVSGQPVTGDVSLDCLGSTVYDLIRATDNTHWLSFILSAGCSNLVSDNLCRGAYLCNIIKALIPGN